MTYPSWKQIFIPSILILILSIIIIRPNGLVKLIGQLDSKNPVGKEVVNEAVEVKQQSQQQQQQQQQQSQQQPQQQPRRHKPANGNNQETFLSSLKSKVLNDIIPITPDHLNISSIDCYNNVHLSPRLQSIIHMDYFRFVKINLKKPCSLWPDDTKCSERDCTIRFCEESDLPPSIVSQEGSEIAIDEKECKDSDLSELDETISTEHEETMDSLFECSEQDDGQYIDLLLNPERFTGYRGESAQRIWKSIYEENCFFKHPQKMSASNPFSLDNLCFEERIFYRAISGLHSSINIHLTALYPVVRGSATFTYNSKEFLRRFNGKQDYITNLYFLYLLELRALSKIEPYLLNRVNWQSSGDSTATRDAIKDLLKAVKSFKWNLDEGNLFKNRPVVNQHEFGEHFRNITNNIMDCVGCEKCKLWGKIQTHGLGTAFKVLIHGDNLNTLHLSRHEITCLFNSVAKLSRSIQFIEDFHRLLLKNDHNTKMDSTSSLRAHDSIIKSTPSPF